MNCRRNLALIVVATVVASALNQSAAAAERPEKVKAGPVPDVPFFLLNDNRLTYSYQFTASNPGSFSVQPNGSVNGKTAKQVFSFTHFDVWAYGTNFFNVDLLKSDHNDPAGPCTNAGVLANGTAATCSGETDIYGIIRSTFGWNEIFDTKAFRAGPLKNISFEIGFDGETANAYYAPNTRSVVAGLQFQFDLPYKGYFNVAPLAVQSWGHKSFSQCGLFGPGIPGVTCLADGNQTFQPTWKIETNYYMDLGFLPESIRYFSVSGRVSVTGPKGDSNTLPALSGVGRLSTASKTELNSEPIRVTFDVSKALWGQKYAHFVDTWVAYRYWRNKFGRDENGQPGSCTITATGVSTNSCYEKTVSAGVSMKF